MEVQRPFLDRLLEMYPNLEIHLWDLTRNADDAAYLRTRVTDRVKVIDHLRSNYRCRYPNRDRRRGEPPCLCMTHKPPYEEPYKWYAEQSEYEGAVFVKVDDDVLFLETERFDDLLAPLHENPHFANACHEHFLVNWETAPSPHYLTFKTRGGEAISINCIAFTYQTMQRVAREFTSNPRLGDEGVFDSLLPWIVPTFRAAHLSFGPQEKALGEEVLQSLRDRYAYVAKEYLS